MAASDDARGATPAPCRIERALPWREPLDLARALRAAGEDVLLLDGMGLHPEARMAYVTAGWRREVRIQDGAIEERHPSGAIEAIPDDPLDHLRAILAPDPAWPSRSDGAFTGGWVAALGFGFARLLEPSLPARPDDDWPQAILREVCSVFVLDRHARTCTLVAHDPDGDAVGLQERVERLVEAAASASSGTAGAEASGTAARPSAATLPAWRVHAEQGPFEGMVRAARELVHDGDLFQVNLATCQTTDAPIDPFDLVERLARANPSPYMAVLPLGDITIVSGSPEQLVATRGRHVRARPIAGTRGRGADPDADAARERELTTDSKERAEHLMLVDLVRNDLARVSEPGSVHVPELASVERYRHVMHLASRVEGALRPGMGPLDAIAATFPGGTVTGAPKLRATQRILELEPVPRGFYTGSVGVVDRSGDTHLNILIRSLVGRGGQWHVHAGSGIVADSDPAKEWREAGRKAQAMLDAAAGRAPATPATRLGEVRATAAWQPPRPSRDAGAGRRVLVIDNADSFVHNLADHAAALGAAVEVVRSDGAWREALARFGPTHVLLSPGPGWPQDGELPAIVAAVLGRLPVLGVCLGHQALGAAAGATVQRHPSGPVHGKADLVHHTGQGLFAGLPSPLEAMRYHSLAVTEPPAPWVVDARLADGTVMAIRHPGLAAVGLQFHPESVGTPLGLRLLERWLAGPSGAPDTASKQLSTPPSLERAVP